MRSTLINLLARTGDWPLEELGALSQCAPVPVFGNLFHSSIATVGLNPSNREFFDPQGNELQGSARRFHTLSSLKLNSWSHANASHLYLLIESCLAYFKRNPYDRWFGVLERLLNSSGYSYDCNQICHVDLVPFATLPKWGELKSNQRSGLLEVAGNSIATMLRDSEIHTVILNGRGVIDVFESWGQTFLTETPMPPSWSLHRVAGADVKGYAYTGVIRRLANTHLGRPILVLGYNHNLQSSFGVSSKVIHTIGEWIDSELKSSGRKT